LKEFAKKTYESEERLWSSKQKRYVRVTVRRTLPDSRLYFRIVSSLLKHSRIFFIRQMMLTEPKW
jgi:hypothetical protein